MDSAHYTGQISAMMIIFGKLRPYGIQQMLSGWKVMIPVKVRRPSWPVEPKHFESKGVGHLDCQVNVGWGH